jgi:hypothetical protein
MKPGDTVQLRLSSFTAAGQTYAAAGWIGATARQWRSARPLTLSARVTTFVDPGASAHASCSHHHRRIRGLQFAVRWR